MYVCTYATPPPPKYDYQNNPLTTLRSKCPGQSPLPVRSPFPGANRGRGLLPDPENTSVDFFLGKKPEYSSKINVSCR